MVAFFYERVSVNDILPLALVFILLIMNGLATRAVLRDDFSEPVKKGLQLAVVWLLPLLGALLVLAVHRKPERSTGKYREQSDCGDDFGTSGRNVRIIKEALDDD